MAWAWVGYVERAFGHDQIKPVSGGYEQFFFAGGRPMGLTIVEALDTLYVMGLDAELKQGVAWIEKSLTFDIDGDVQVFETNIRMVGGLLSGWLATHNPRLLALARDCADRLLPAFEKSPTGVPYRFVNLKTGAVRDKVTFPAEVGTYIAEFGLLTRETRDQRYFDVAKRAVKAMYDRRSKLDLLADQIDVETGEWKSRRASIGPPTDSYFEYLWDGWQLFSDSDFKQWYDTTATAIRKHQAERVRGQLWYRQVDFETGATLDRHQSELASFYAGLLAQAGNTQDAHDYLAAWASVQERHGVLPEGYDFGTGKPDRVTNQLRPEFVDSCLNLYLVDPRDEWRELTAVHYETMKKHCRAQFGYSGIADITTRPMKQDDSCPGYWWSEQMKYYWLLFADVERFDYRRNYLSTEGNIFVGLK